MKVIFISPQMVQQPTRLLLAMLLSLVWRIVLKSIFWAMMAIVLLVVVTDWPVIFAVLIGSGLVLLGALLNGIMGTVHELAHAFAGARLVGLNYPRALVIPTFGHPFIRFDSRQVKVIPSQVVLVLLTGPISGLLVSMLILVAVLIMPAQWEGNWILLAYWGAITFPQVASLIPIGGTDGHKAKQLMCEHALSWSDVSKAARSLFHK
jgi:hypothetical protein